MNILVSFNDNYAMPTRVMLKSLIENNHCSLNIYVLYIKLSDESINRILEFENAATTIQFIKIDENILDCVPVMSFYSKEAYIRLFAQYYLPEDVDRILWLDSDMIVNGELREFYNQSFNNKLYVAYKDVIQGDSAEKKISLAMPTDVAYINSGILLMNLKEIRINVKRETITNYIKENSDKIKLVDQDVFNGLLYDSIKVIDSDYTYNFFASDITPWNRRIVYRKVRIIHYAMSRKPWNPGYKYFGFHLWWKYALMTDINLISRYRSIFISCYLKKIKFWTRFQIMKRNPKLYKFLKEQRSKQK